MSALLNEPVHDSATFGTPDVLSDTGVKWVLAFFQGILERIEAADAHILVLL